jgi:hypothetical protein
MRLVAGMATAVQPQRRLDDLVIEAIAAFQTQPDMKAADSGVSIEVVSTPAPEPDGEIAVTTQFVRLSAPYERVDLDFEPVATPRKRRTTFVQTIRARETARDIIVPSLPQIMAAETAPAGATQSFEAVWFDKSEDSLSRMLAAQQDRRKQQWLWLAISLTVALIATVVLV